MGRNMTSDQRKRFEFYMAVFRTVATGITAGIIIWRIS